AQSLSMPQGWHLKCDPLDDAHPVFSLRVSFNDAQILSDAIIVAPIGELPIPGAPKPRDFPVV
ncbi:hypothetical protein, partial [Sodalis sp.]|uniref:hypothetical protein n=1 Tax=Sodalis sp. (in: enterobacteria) TaxID=1898979 RepID=UPI0038738473